MPLIDPELLPFVDEVRAENAAMAERAKESFGSFDLQGDVTAQMRAMMEAGWRVRPATLGHGGGTHDPRARGRHPDPRLRAADGRRRVPLDSRWRVHDGEPPEQRPGQRAHRPGVQRRGREPRVPHGTRAPVPRRSRRLRGGRGLAARARRRASSGATGSSIGGESAGGHIAAVTVLRLRDRHDAADRLFGANLNCGVYDITGTPSRHLPPPENDVLAIGGGGSLERGHVLQLGHQPDRPRRLTALCRPPRSVPGAVHRRHRRHAARRQRVHGRPLGARRERDRARGVPARSARRDRVGERDRPARAGARRRLHPHAREELSSSAEASPAE